MQQVSLQANGVIVLLLAIEKEAWQSAARVVARSEEDSFASLGTGSVICSVCHCEEQSDVAIQRRHTLRLLQPFGLRNDRRVCHCKLSKGAWQSHQAARKLVDVFTLPEHIGVEKALY